MSQPLSTNGNFAQPPPNSPREFAKLVQTVKHVLGLLGKRSEIAANMFEQLEEEISNLLLHLEQIIESLGLHLPDAADLLRRLPRLPARRQSADAPKALSSLMITQDNPQQFLIQIRLDDLNPAIAELLAVLIAENQGQGATRERIAEKLAINPHNLTQRLARLGDAFEARGLTRNFIQRNDDHVRILHDR